MPRPILSLRVVPRDHRARMEMVLAWVDALCFRTIRGLLLAAAALEDWRRAVRRGARRLRGSIRKLHRAYIRRNGAIEPPVRRRARNRTPVEIEEEIVRLHVAAPHLGAGQLRYLAHRVLGFSAARETIRRIVLRNAPLIGALQRDRARLPRRIVVRAARQLWGMDLTLVWVLGLLPVWLLGVVDYYGSRVVVLEPLRWPTSSEVARVLARSLDEHGAPARILSDRGSVFRAPAVQQALTRVGTVHVMTRPHHPWTNGRIERLFRTFKETTRAAFWIIRSPAQLERICGDFRCFYNEHRPHQSNGGRTPAEVFAGKPARPSQGRIAFFEGRLHWWRLL